MQKLFSELANSQMKNNRESEGRFIHKMHFTGRKSVNQFTAGSVEQRFFYKLAFGMSTCWYWKGAIDNGGYGTMNYSTESKAHRVSWTLHNGEIPKGLMVLHKCDVRNCVNPEHLFLGTQKDNMEDMVKKGRGVSPKLIGEKNPMSKINQVIADEIREFVAMGNMQIVAARKFNLSPMTISRIIRKETWQ